MADEETKIKTYITMSQAIGFLVAIIMAVASSYLSTQNRITILEVQMRNGEINFGKIENKIDKVSMKQDDLMQVISDIKSTQNQNQYK